MPGADSRPGRFATGILCARLLRGALLALLVACGGGDAAIASIAAPDGTSELDDAESPGASFVAPKSIAAVTYDGSGELVHPDAAVFPQRWQGARYWVAATPYPAGNPKLENPSIYRGRISSEMTVPEGVTNPIVAAPSIGYLSDPDVVRDPDRGELRMYYRQTAGDADQLFLTSSANGVLWSPAALVTTGSRYALISPSIVRESATSWRMWTVNASSHGCFSLITELALEQRRSTDGVVWSAPEPVQLRLTGRVPWHWDVQFVPAKGEYWALVAAYPEGTTCSQTSVYFARSADGTTWNVSPTPLLGRGEFEAMRDLVYRSSFHYHEGSDAVSVWFSGARLEGRTFRYSVASARYPYAELLRRVSGGTPMILGREGSATVSAELRAARDAFERDFP
jgi:hypothetical protein